MMQEWPSITSLIDYAFAHKDVFRLLITLWRTIWSDDSFMGHHLFSKLKSVDALYSLFSELSVHTNMDGVIVFGRWIGKYYYIRFMECGTKRGFVQRFVLPGVFKYFNITFNDVVLEDTTPHVDITDDGGHLSNGVLPHVGTQRSVNKWRYFFFVV